jgi:hypothetical protein
MNCPAVCALLLASLGSTLAAEPNAPARSDTDKRVLNLLVVNYDPVLTNHGSARLSRHSKWNNPRPMTTNLIRYIRESSGGFADYRVQTRCMQGLHAIANRPDARKHHAFGAQNFCAFGGDAYFNRSGSDVLQSFGDGMQIAHSVIDNSD